MVRVTGDDNAGVASHGDSAAQLKRSGICTVSPFFQLVAILEEEITPLGHMVRVTGNDDAGETSHGESVTELKRSGICIVSPYSVLHRRHAARLVLMKAAILWGHDTAYYGDTIHNSFAASFRQENVAAERSWRAPEECPRFCSFCHQLCGGLHDPSSRGCHQPA